MLSKELITQEILLSLNPKLATTPPPFRGIVGGGGLFRSIDGPMNTDLATIRLSPGSGARTTGAFHSFNAGHLRLNRVADNAIATIKHCLNITKQFVGTLNRKYFVLVVVKMLKFPGYIIGANTTKRAGFGITRDLLDGY